MSLKSKSLFVLPLIGAAPAANAADMPVMPPPEVSPLIYLSIEGGPIWMEGDLSETGADKFGDFDNQDGFYAAITYRRFLNPTWDWQITATGTWLDEISGRGFDEEAGDVRFTSDLDFQTIDLDAGYHFNGNPLTRFLFGIRALHSRDELNYEDFFGPITYKAEGWAFGPRVGFQSETMLGSSRFGFVAEASGSILFGSFDIETQANDVRTDSSRTIYNLEGLAGLSWHANDTWTFTAGYRLQQWWNLREGTAVSDQGYTLSADEDPLLHGPFLRVATTF